MRETQEQVREVLKRAERFRELRRLRRKVFTDAALALVFLLLLAASASVIPGLGDGGAQSGHWQYGSLFLGSRNMGYFVTGMLSFALGVFAVLLCVHWRQLRKAKREKR